MNDVRRYDGMTVNERLFESGLIGDYDAAAIAMDKRKIKEILFEVGISEEGAEQIIEWEKSNKDSTYNRTRRNRIPR